MSNRPNRAEPGIITWEKIKGNTRVVQQRTRRTNRGRKCGRQVVIRLYPYRGQVVAAVVVGRRAAVAGRCGE